MKIKIINEIFSVCQVKDYSSLHLEDGMYFISKTDEENSLVCPVNKIPNNVITREDGWKAFRIEGILDFSLIGILAKIASILAQNNISIFAVSTYNTDYIFIKNDNFTKAIDLLKENNYTIID